MPGGCALATGGQRSRDPDPEAFHLRPEPPARYRASFLEQWGAARLLSPETRMVIRHLERQPLRAALSSLGVALAIGILVLGNFTEDTVDHVMNFQFQRVQRQDVTVTFVEPVTGGVRIGPGSRCELPPPATTAPSP